MPNEHNRITAKLARWALITSLALLLTLISGCVNALYPYNQSSQQKLRIQSLTPQKYTIRIADKSDYLVPTDGHITVNIPQFKRGCAMYLFGIVKVSDSSPYDFRIIHLINNNHTIQKLSLNDIARLPIDEQGYRLVKVE